MSLFDAFKRKKEPGLLGGGVMTGSFYDQFPKSQLFVPRCEYPLWDSDWEHLGRRRRSVRQVLKNGSQRQVTRHIFLVRHGQYREDLTESDAKRMLTKKGREQAKKTGEWLAEIIRKNNILTTTAKMKMLSCSSMARAKQTADIIYSEISSMYETHNESCEGKDYTEGKKWEPMQRDEPDPLLVEGRPCHHIPSMGEKTSKDVIAEIDEDWPRMEEAFRKYIARSRWLEENQGQCVDVEKAKECPVEREHEYQIIVSHANLIRYLVCRALQIPPEAWLRLSLFNGSVTYLVIHSTGEVTLRLFGEIGHMGYDLVTANLYEGFNWDSYEFYKTAIERQEDNESS